MKQGWEVCNGALLNDFLFFIKFMVMVLMNWGNI